MKKIINTDKAPAPVGPYSQAVSVNGFLYCSGQIPLNPATNQIELGTVEEQTKLVMENVRAVLEAADMQFSNIIKTAIFITDMDDFSKINSVYAEYFPEVPPARSCVQVSRLPKDVNVEIEVIAYK